MLVNPFLAASGQGMPWPRYPPVFQDSAVTVGLPTFPLQDDRQKVDLIVRPVVVLTVPPAQGPVGKAG